MVGSTPLHQIEARVNPCRIGHGAADVPGYAAHVG
jgi:hypothetical protein